MIRIIRTKETADIIYIDTVASVSCSVELITFLIIILLAAMLPLLLLHKLVLSRGHFSLRWIVDEKITDSYQTRNT